MPIFGEDVEGVRGVLPWRTIDASTRPTAVQVTAMLAEIAGQVAARIGPVGAVPEDQRENVTVWARRLVHQGTASLVEAAGEPEALEGRQASAYASWLWERFTEGLEQLGSLVDALVPGVGPAGAAEVELGEAEWSFPAPSNIGQRGL
jgi:hypothetical protein